MVYKPKRKAAPKPKPNPKKKPATKRKAASSKKRVSLFDKARPRIEGHAAGGTISAFIKGGRLVPSYIKTLLKGASHQHTTKNFGVSYNCLQGSQGVKCPGVPLMTISAMNDIRNMIATQTGLTYAQLNSQKFLLLKANMTYTVRNDNNNEMVLDIYDIQCRRDAVDIDEGQDPITKWNQGNQDSGGSAFDSSCPGATPFQSIAFTQYYKVNKVTNCIIPAGACHEHKISCHVNRSVNFEYLANYQQYRNMSMYCVFVWRGVPAAIAGIPDVCSLTPMRIDVLNQHQYDFAVPETSRSYQTTVNTLDTLAHLNFVNDETGLVETPVSGG